MATIKDIKALEEARAEEVRTVNEITETVEREGRAMNEGEFVQFDKAQENIAEYDAQIETVRRLNTAKAYGKSGEVVSQRGGQRISDDERDLALRSWLLHQAGAPDKITTEMRHAAEKAGVVYGQKEMQIKRAQTVGTTTEGGFLANTTLPVSEIDVMLKAYGGVRSVARVVPTTEDGVLPWTTVDYTTRKAAVIGENTATTNTSIVFGQVNIECKKFSSAVFPISYEVVKNARIPIMSIINEALAESFGRQEADDFTDADGTNKIYGIIDDTTGFVEGAEATLTTAVDVDELIELYYSVDPLYRNKPGTCWMFNDQTMRALHSLKYTDDKPVLVNDYNGGGFTTLLGKPIVINNDMPNMAASAKPIVFGDFSKYIIRDADVLRIKMSDQVYWLEDAFACIGHKQTGGRVVNRYGAKHLVMAAA